MRLLVKIGGTLVDEAARRDALAQQLAKLAGNHAVVVVHGGGKQMTRFLEERGIQSAFVNGLRVSDEGVIDAALKVIAGSVNKQLVAALQKAGQKAVGLSGVDGQLTRAERWSEELGYVGRPVESNGALLDLLLNAGYLPTVACLAADLQGVIYNVNADQMAVSCAVAFRSDVLLFLTDVPGVKNAEGAVLERLMPTGAASLIQAGTAHGGMQAKLEAACAGLEGGVKEIMIAPGTEPDICARLLGGEALGTKLTLQPLPAGQGSLV